MDFVIWYSFMFFVPLAVVFGVAAVIRPDVFKF